MQICDLDTREQRRVDGWVERPAERAFVVRKLDNLCARFTCVKRRAGLHLHIPRIVNSQAHAKVTDATFDRCAQRRVWARNDDYSRNEDCHSCDVHIREFSGFHFAS